MTEKFSTLFIVLATPVFVIAHSLFLYVLFCSLRDAKLKLTGNRTFTGVFAKKLSFRELMNVVIPFTTGALLVGIIILI